MKIIAGKLRKEDHRKAVQFAIKGMHFSWYLGSKILLDIYGTYFWWEELNKATQIFSAYDDDGNFAGILLAEVKGEQKKFRSFWKNLFVKFITAVEHLFVKDVDSYYLANRKMFSNFSEKKTPDGEIIFFAANPESKGKGIGSALLSEFEKQNPGKLFYLYTDSGCTYQFYEKRGFKRECEENVKIETGKNIVPLRCFLYSKRFPDFQDKKVS